MKNLKFLVAPFLLALTMLSCSSDNVKESDLNDQNKEVFGAGGKVTIKAKLHRGDNWSNRRNVPPCSMSFGICQVSVQIEVTIPVGYQKIDLELLRADVLRIAFSEGVQIPEDRIFFSKEDGYFAFPSEVSEQFQLAKMEIVPDDYIVQLNNPTYPHGFVDVKLRKR